jgi:hypothetical protein
MINAWTGGTITAGILTVLFLVALCCLWDDLKRAINVIDASADFLADTFRIIATPFTHMIFQLIVLAIWIPAFACVLSMNEIKANPNIPQMKSFKWEDEIKGLAAFMGFGILWILTMFS